MSPFREIPREQRNPHAIYKLLSRKRKKVSAGKSKWYTKTKNIFHFNQGQYIKVKENKTRIKIGEFCK